MNNHKPPKPLPAPCIVESGTIINKEDMRRLLNDLGRVHYIHSLDDEIKNEGEGWIMEIFADPQQATIITNHALYINLQSFDYLELVESLEQQTYFDLIQDNRKLRLISLSNPVNNEQFKNPSLDLATLEAMVTEVLSAQWDVQFDDEDYTF